MQHPGDGRERRRQLWVLLGEVEQSAGALGEVRPLLAGPAALQRRDPGHLGLVVHVLAHEVGLKLVHERGVAELSKCANVACKISGLFTEVEPADTAALALRMFGPERCMWGSDWPVTLLAAGYGDGLALIGDDPRVLGETAVATYGLQVP